MSASTKMPTLPIELGNAHLDPSAASNGDASIDAFGIKLAADPNVSSTLAGTPFSGNGNLDRIASLTGQAVTAGSTHSITMSTADFSKLSLVKGEKITFTYAWATFDHSSTNKDYAFGLVQKEGGSIGAITLANQSLLSAAGAQDQATFGYTITINSTGIYDFLFGDVYNGSSSGSALRIESVTITDPVSGPNAATWTPNGLLRADGSLLQESGNVLGLDGTTLPLLSAGGAALIQAGDGHLLSQDGGGLISQDGGGIISHDGGGIISHDGGGVISHDGGGLISQDGGGLISQDGGGLVSRSGGSATASYSLQSTDSGSSSNAEGLIYSGVDANGHNVYQVTSSRPQTVTPTAPTAPTLQAPSQVGGDIVVGTKGPSASAQVTPSIAALSSGRAVVVWSDSLGTSGKFEIRAQILNADGSAFAPSFVVSTDTSHGDQIIPSVTGVKDGGFVVTWRGVSSETSHSPADVHLQLFDANGAKVRGEATVAPTGTNELGPQVASLYDGGFVLTYQIKGNGAAASTGIAVRYNANRDVVGVPVAIGSTASTANVSSLAATGLSNGGYVVAYRQQVAGASDPDGIYLDVIGNDGSVVQSQIAVNSQLSTIQASNGARPGLDGTQTLPSVATLRGGNVVVAWIDDGTSFAGGQAIARAQVIDPSTGAKVGSQIELGAVVADASAPSVVALADGTFSVTWSAASLKDGNVVGATLQTEIFSANGAAFSPITTIAVPSGYREEAPAATQLANGDIFVVGSVTNGNTSFIQMDRLGTGTSANHAPSGSDLSVNLVPNGYDSSQHRLYRHVFEQADFGFSDPDGDALSAVTVKTLPVGGGLTLNGAAVTAGQVISVDEINASHLVYQSASTSDHSFTFQVQDTGGADGGGADTDPTPNTVTLHINAIPVLANVPSTVAYAGGTKTIAPGITITDADDTTMSQAQVSFSPDGYVSGDTLSVAGVDPGTGKIAGTNIRVSGGLGGALNFDGLDTLAHYQQALEAVTYSYTGSAAATGATGDRTVFWFVTDAHGGHNSDSNVYSMTTISPGASLSVSTSPATGAIGLGKSLNINVSTNGLPMTVTGSPSLKLNDGGTATFNKTASDLAHGTIVFTYTAAAGQNTANLTITSVVLPSGASIKAGGTSIATSVLANVSLNHPVDTAAPKAPTFLRIDDSYDTGASNHDGLTKSTSPVVLGTGTEANAIVTLYDGTTAIGRSVADTSGVFTITPTVALSKGTHKLTVKAMDEAGNVSAASPTVTAVIDTTAPGTPAAPKLAGDTGASPTDGIIADATPTFTGTAEANATIQLFAFDGLSLDLVATTTASFKGAYSVTVGTALADESYTFKVAAVDQAGNQSALSGEKIVTIDTTSPDTPAAPTLDHASDTSNGFYPDDGITADATPTIHGTAEIGAAVTLYDKAKTKVGSAVADSNGAYTITSSKLADGAHALTVTATDAAGNVSAPSAALSITIDTKAPATPTLALDVASDTGVSSKDGITNVKTPTLTGKAEAGALVLIYDGTKPLTYTLASSTGTFSVTTPDLDDGPHKLTARVRDAAGNTSAASIAKTVVIDTIDPSVAITTPAAGGAGKRTVSGTGEAGSSVTLTENGAKVGTTVTVGSRGTWSETITFKTTGAHDLVATAVDKAGNVASSLNAMAQAMATMTPQSSAAMTSSAPAPSQDHTLAAAHG